MPPFVIGEFSATDLLDRFGSPLFVLDHTKILNSVARLQEAFSHPAIELLYAMKANPNLRIVELLYKNGIGMDCCSPGEVFLAIRAGIPAEHISFTGTALTDQDVVYLASTGVRVNLDALSQVERYAHRFASRGIGIRVNPGTGTGSHACNTTGGEDSKLGIPIDQAAGAISLAKKSGGRISGLHVHTGSGGLDVNHFIHVARTMFHLADAFSEDLEYIDLGGGIGVPHRPTDAPFDLTAYGQEVGNLIDDWEAAGGRKLKVIIEPGQFYVSEAGWLLMSVVVRKKTPTGRIFILTDSSFNHYLGTSLYQSHHEFVLANDTDRPGTETVDICGHLCNTGDTFARQRLMPILHEGDCLAMAQAGAYGLSRASNYNSRPIPAEIFVHGNNATLIRRRQTFEDLLICQQEKS